VRSMETSFENGDNTANEKLSLLNYLLTYLMKERKEPKKPRYNLTIRVSEQVYRDFDTICRKLGLTSRGKTNIALEGLFAYFIEQYRDRPTVIQQTLTNIFVKAEPNSEVIIDLSQKLEAKLVRKNLAFFLDRLENKKGRPDVMIHDFRKTLSEAIQIYRKTRDSDLEKLLKQSEKWI
jgi:hypothetical protein